MSCADLKLKLNVATELRDNIDQLCNGPTYTLFLKKLIPIFVKLLEGPPVFTSTSWEHVGSNTLSALGVRSRDPMVLTSTSAEITQLRP
jgi:hypothetical protein